MHLQQLLTWMNVYVSDFSDFRAIIIFSTRNTSNINKCLSEPGFWTQEATQQTFVLMKTSWRRLEDVFRLCLQKTSSRHLQDVLPRCLQDVFKTFPRRLTKTSWKRLQDVFQKHLQDIFKTSSRRFQGVFQTSLRRLTKMSSRRFQDLSSSYAVLVNKFSRCLQDVFTTFLRRTAKINLPVYLDR